MIFSHRDLLKIVRVLFHVVVGVEVLLIEDYPYESLKMNEGLKWSQGLNSHGFIVVRGNKIFFLVLHFGMVFVDWNDRNLFYGYLIKLPCQGTFSWCQGLFLVSLLVSWQDLRVFKVFVYFIDWCFRKLTLFRLRFTVSLNFHG